MAELVNFRRIVITAEEAPTNITFQDLVTFHNRYFKPEGYVGKKIEEMKHMNGGYSGLAITGWVDGMGKITKNRASNTFQVVVYPLVTGTVLISLYTINNQNKSLKPYQTATKYESLVSGIKNSHDMFAKAPEVKKKIAELAKEAYRDYAKTQKQ